MEDSLAVDLVKRDLEREASERYKSFVIRSRLSSILNEAVKHNTRLEEFRGFPCRYIESVKSLDEHVLWSNRDIREAFRVHFRDRFDRLPDLLIQEFRSYLADFPRLQEAEVAGFEGLVTECEVRDALRQVGLNKSLGLNGLPNEVYLRMLHMFVPILTDTFNHCFAQGVIIGNITKSDHIAEERWQECLGGTRRLQAHNSAKHRVKDFDPSLSEPIAACP